VNVSSRSLKCDCSYKVQIMKPNKRQNAENEEKSLKRGALRQQITVVDRKVTSLKRRHAWLSKGVVQVSLRDGYVELAVLNYLQFVYNYVKLNSSVMSRAYMPIHSELMCVL